MLAKMTVDILNLPAYPKRPMRKIKRENSKKNNKIGILLCSKTLRIGCVRLSLPEETFNIKMLFMVFKTFFG
ncbi:MAG: hypothetical protein BWY02_00980 [bacterium ADurb.Bin157]|nr:MAG: hypothetical protein BWY02_00980 [bacterium ADurb.Bin157]